MKKNNGAILGALMFGALTSNLVAVMVVGAGSESSFLILESPNVGLRTYEVFYDVEEGSLLGSDDLLTIVDGADALISLALGGDPGNRFLNAVTFNDVTETFDGSNFWTQWAAGGEGGGFFDYENLVFVPVPEPLPSGSWTFGSGSSAPARIVQPGSSDAYVFSASALPSIDPIPEPSSGALLFGSALLLAIRRRRS